MQATRERYESMAAELTECQTQVKEGRATITRLEGQLNEYKRKDAEVRVSVCVCVSLCSMMCAACAIDN